MGTFHFSQRVSGLNDFKDVQQAVYDHIVHASNTLFNIVSVWDGSAYGVTPTSASWNTDGAMFVFEPSADVENWDSGRWQGQLGVADASGSDLFANLGPNRDWADGGAPATPGAFGTVDWQYPVGVSSPDNMWNRDGFNPVGGELVLTSCDLDGYPYLRGVLWDSGATVAPNWGFYIGGYSPFTTADTKPCCIIVGDSEINDSGGGGNLDAMGVPDITTPSNLKGRAPIEFGTAVTSMAAAGYATLNTDLNRAFVGGGQTKGGIYPGGPITLLRRGPDHLRGFFGKNTWLSYGELNNNDRARASVGGNPDYLVFGNIGHYAPGV